MQNSRYLLVTFAALVSTVVHADVVTLRNGDRLSGELKSLERGKLRFDSAATGTIPIEWDEVATLVSGQDIQKEIEDGTRFLGPLSTAVASSDVVVETAQGPVTLAMAEVILMTPIEKRARDRIDAGVTFGYSFAKSTEVEQLNAGFDLVARTEKRLYSLNADVIVR